MNCGKIHAAMENQLVVKLMGLFPLHSVIHLKQVMRLYDPGTSWDAVSDVDRQAGYDSWLQACAEDILNGTTAQINSLPNSTEEVSQSSAQSEEVVLDSMVLQVLAMFPDADGDWVRSTLVYTKQRFGDNIVDRTCNYMFENPFKYQKKEGLSASSSSVHSPSTSHQDKTHSRKNSLRIDAELLGLDSSSDEDLPSFLPCVTKSSSHKAKSKPAMPSSAQFSDPRPSTSASMQTSIQTPSTPLSLQSRDPMSSTSVSAQTSDPRSSKSKCVSSAAKPSTSESITHLNSCSDIRESAADTSKTKSSGKAASSSQCQSGSGNKGQVRRPADVPCSASPLASRPVDRTVQCPQLSSSGQGSESNESTTPNTQQQSKGRPSKDKASKLSPCRSLQLAKELESLHRQYIQNRKSEPMPSTTQSGSRKRALEIGPRGPSERGGQFKRRTLSQPVTLSPPPSSSANREGRQIDLAPKQEESLLSLGGKCKVPGEPTSGSQECKTSVSSDTSLGSSERQCRSKEPHPHRRSHSLPNTTSSNVLHQQIYINALQDKLLRISQVEEKSLGMKKAYYKQKTKLVKRLQQEIANLARRHRLGRHDQTASGQPASSVTANPAQPGLLKQATGTLDTPVTSRSATTKQPAPESKTPMHVSSRSVHAHDPILPGYVRSVSSSIGQTAPSTASHAQSLSSSVNEKTTGTSSSDSSPLTPAQPVSRGLSSKSSSCRPVSSQLTPDHFKFLSSVGRALTSSSGLKPVPTWKMNTISVPSSLASRRMNIVSTPSTCSARMGTVSTPSTCSARMGTASTPATSSARVGTASTPASSSARMGTASVPSTSSARMGTASTPATSSTRMGTASTPATSSARTGTASTPATSSARVGTASTPATSSARMGTASMPSTSSARMGTASIPATSSARMGIASTPATSSARMGTASTPATSSARMGTASTPATSSARMGTASTPATSSARMGTASTPATSSANMNPSSSSAGSSIKLASLMHYRFKRLTPRSLQTSSSESSLESHPRSSADLESPAAACHTEGRSPESSVTEGSATSKSPDSTSKPVVVVKEYATSSRYCELRCEACDEYKVHDLQFDSMIQCSDGHILCRTCVEAQAKEALSNPMKFLVPCACVGCGFPIPREELVRVLPIFIADMLEEKRIKYNLIRNREDYVRCPNCIYGESLELSVKQFSCKNDYCLSVTCRHCTLPWSGSNHSRCGELLGEEPQEASGLDLPARWSSTSENGKIFIKELVQPSSQEWANVRAMFSRTLAEAQIKYIHRVQNPRLWRKYCVTRNNMLEDNGEAALNEKNAFHGTNPEVVESICRDGFDWRMCGRHGVSYGQGAYFARDAVYSHKYAEKAQQARPTTVMARGHFMMIAQALGIQPMSASMSVAASQPTVVYSRAGNAASSVPSAGLQSVTTPTSSGRASQQGWAPPTPTPAHQSGANASATNTVVPGSKSRKSVKPQIVRPTASGPVAYPSQYSSLFMGGAGSTQPAPSSSADEPTPTVKQYTMFVAKVLIGRPTVGKGTYRKPPKDLSFDDGRTYDSCVDNVSNPQIYVIFDSSQAYPEYVITYTL